MPPLTYAKEQRSPVRPVTFTAIHIWQFLQINANQFFEIRLKNKMETTSIQKLAELSLKSFLSQNHENKSPKSPKKSSTKSLIKSSK